MRLLACASTLLAYGAVAASSPAPAAASALEGISDQNLAQWAGAGVERAGAQVPFAAFVASTWLSGAPGRIELARFVVPWDVMADTADDRLAFERLRAWYGRVLELGLIPDIALTAGEPGSYGGLQLGALPATGAQYERYLRELLSAFAAVRYLEPWNEPNAQGVDAATAARYYLAGARLCERPPDACIALAGDLLDSDPQMVSYERAYERSLPAASAVRQWAIHPYYAVNHYADNGLPYPPPGASTVDAFEHALPEPAADSVWFTEIGAFYCEVASAGSGKLGTVFGPAVQRAAASYLTRVLMPGTRPVHVFYYELAYGFGLQTPCASPDALGRTYTDSALYSPEAPGEPERSRPAAAVILAAALAPAPPEALREPFWSALGRASAGAP